MVPEPQPDRPQPDPSPKAEVPALEAVPQSNPKSGPSPEPQRRGPGSRTPGEAYTPMPDFPARRSFGWRYLAAAAALALSLTFGYLKLHTQTHPAGTQAAKAVVEQPAQPSGGGAAR